MISINKIKCQNKVTTTIKKKISINSLTLNNPKDKNKTTLIIKQILKIAKATQIHIVKVRWWNGCIVFE